MNQLRTERSCVILQPSYIPWRGVFDLIERADVFVHYDTVTFDKGGWRHRNRIWGSNGAFWLTIPVTLGDGSLSTRLNDVLIDPHGAWRRKHLAAIKQSYSKMSNYAMVEEVLEPLRSLDSPRLTDLTVSLLERTARELQISTKFIRSSDVEHSGTRSEKLVDICRQVGANHYISGPSARSYLEISAFEEAGIRVSFIDYSYSSYEGLVGGRESNVSIIDTIATFGLDWREAIRGSRLVK